MKLDDIPVDFFGQNKVARVGISHVTSHIGQHMIPKMKNISGIHLNTSSQPNSNPHFGTITTMMTAFAIAAELRDFFNIPTKLTFDQLENAPDRGEKGLKKTVYNEKEIEYQISLKDSVDNNGKSVLEKNMIAFKNLFTFLSGKTEIPYVIRSYDECQSSIYFRKALLSMFQQEDTFKPIVSPDENHMRLRFPCPVCKWVDKGSVNTNIYKKTKDSIIFSAICPEHGIHYAELSSTSKSFFDTNTPLRDVAKGAALIEEAKEENYLPVMLDGRDWSGRWNNMIFSEGITRLGYKFHELPVRFFSPIITDRLGAKLSKSLYIGKDTYNYMPEGFMDYDSFMKKYGQYGLELLWSHVRDWARDPAFLDRDSYSIDYFKLFLEGKLPMSNIVINKGKQHE